MVVVIFLYISYFPLHSHWGNCMGQWNKILFFFINYPYIISKFTNLGDGLFPQSLGCMSGTHLVKSSYKILETKQNKNKNKPYTVFGLTVYHIQ